MSASALPSWRDRFHRWQRRNGVGPPALSWPGIVYQGWGWYDGLGSVKAAMLVAGIILFIFSTAMYLFTASTLVAAVRQTPESVEREEPTRAIPPTASLPPTIQPTETTAALLPIDVLLTLVNIGTLLAFVIVCSAVLIMRRTHPDVERPFRAPLVPLVPILGIAICLLLMFSLPAENWLRLLVWLLIGFAIYFGYGRKHSVMARRLEHEIKARGVSPAGSITGSIEGD